MSKTKSLISLFTVVCAISFAAAIVFAWSEPSTAPPGGNVAVPINTGDTSQSKTGDLNIGGKVGIGTTTPVYKLEVQGDINISSDSAYKIGGTDILWATSTGQGAFVGEGAGANNTGWASTFMGYQAGYNNSGDMNTFIGRWAGLDNNTGYANTFVGYNAGDENTTGHSNTFIGQIAGGANQTGDYNTFVGRNAGEYNVDTDANTCLGYRAGYAIGGFNNTYLGYRAGGSLGASGNSGNYNTFVGYNTGGENTIGSSNLFIGTSAGRSNLSGSNNVFLGDYAGYNNKTGSNNVFIGYKAGYYAATSSSDKLYVANGPNSSDTLIYGDFSSGNVGIGTLAVSSKLTVDGIIESASGGVKFPDGSLQVTAATGGGGGGDIRFPDGYEGTAKNIEIVSPASYTVPAGKTLYITTEEGSSGGIYIGGVRYYATLSTTGTSFSSPLIIPGGSVITANVGTLHITGVEVDAGVTAKNIEIVSPASYTVPAGKTLYITTEEGSSGGIYIGGVRYYATLSTTGTSFSSPLIIPGGSVITANVGTLHITGYEK